LVLNIGARVATYKTGPQRLKPHSFDDTYGTTEVVPSPETSRRALESRPWRRVARLYNGGMQTGEQSVQMHGTTVLCVRKDNKVVLIADGQVTMGDHVMKHSARKTRRLYNDKVIVGFAGSTADAISLFERFEGKLQEHSGNLAKAAVELAKEWRKDRALRHLEALLIVADTKGTFLLSGTGDVIEPDDGICAIGSGGTYALSAARALLKHSKLGAKDLAMEAMRIASEICIYTNANFTVEEL
jgi:ATP-dependent HslUV protease, peptidase subunit HslV